MSAAEWPELPYASWTDTLDTLHMVLQILGKVRVALSPKEPEWAHITLYVSTRGLTTGPVPSAAGLLEVEADFVDHQVVITTSAGDATTVALRPRPIAEFWTEFRAALRSVGVDTELSTMPQEVADPIAFPDDTTHHAYEPAADAHASYAASRNSRSAAAGDGAVRTSSYSSTNSPSSEFHPAFGEFSCTCSMPSGFGYAYA